jgi:putative transposase
MAARLFHPLFALLASVIGATIKRNTPLSPNLRVHVELFIQTLKVEYLDKFVIVAQRHLNHITREFQVHYNRERPHEACGHLPLGADPPSTLPLRTKSSDVACTTRLGELLKSNRRRPA